MPEEQLQNLNESNANASAMNDELKRLEDEMMQTINTLTYQAMLIIKIHKKKTEMLEEKVRLLEAELESQKRY